MYTREELIARCEKSIVNVKLWRNRDTPGAQEGVGHLWALLKAGCEFKVQTAENDTSRSKMCITDDRTIWVVVLDVPTFNTFDQGTAPCNETFYLPTDKRLEEAAGTDWY